MSEIDMNAVLAQMRVMRAKAQAAQVLEQPQRAAGADFSSLVAQAISQVNETQQAATAKAKAFEQGAQGVDLGDVMVSLQKANISFQAMTQVRNRLVSAYEEIMNMPV